MTHGIKLDFNFLLALCVCIWLVLDVLNHPKCYFSTKQQKTYYLWCNKSLKKKKKNIVAWYKNLLLVAIVVVSCYSYFITKDKFGLASMTCVYRCRSLRLVLDFFGGDGVMVVLRQWLAMIGNANVSASGVGGHE